MFIFELKQQSLAEMFQYFIVTILTRILFCYSFNKFTWSLSLLWWPWFSSNTCTSYGKKSMFWVSDLPLSLILTFVWLGWGDLANEPPTSRPSTVTPEPLYYNSNEKNTIHQHSFLFGKQDYGSRLSGLLHVRLIGHWCLFGSLVDYWWLLRQYI